jgi:hypothetical protein
MDEEIFELELIDEFAFAATKFIYADGGPVVCYDCDAVIAYLAELGMGYDEAIDYMEETVTGSRYVWLHDIDFDVEFTPNDKPHLRLVH